MKSPFEVLRFDGGDGDVIAIVSRHNREQLIIDLTPTYMVLLIADLSVAVAESFTEQAEARELAATAAPDVDPARVADDYATPIPTDEHHYPLGAGIGRTYPRQEATS